MDRRSLLAAVALLAGCGTVPSSDSEQTAGTTATPGATPTVSGDARFGLTALHSDGNPVLDASFDLRTAQTLDVDLQGTPVWLAGVTQPDGTLWATVLDDGRGVGIRVNDDGGTNVSLPPDRLDGPPLLVAGDEVRVASPETLAQYTHPVPVAGGLSWVRGDGRLRTPGGVADIDALPDGVPVADDGRVFVLAEPTDSYSHGVLGDEIEAASVAVVDAASGTVERYLRPPEGTVIEGRSTMLATLGGDPAAVVTASDGEDGARIVAFGVDGDWRAVGPPIGGGFRWRHQLAVAPFGPDGEQSIATVKTPHIGGVAEFYRRDGDRLTLDATDDGSYQSHEIGSRNLGGGMAGRFAGDDRWLLLVPDRPRESLMALSWDGGESGSTVERVFSLSLGGALATNLAAVEDSGETSAVFAAGTDAGVRFWLDGS
jgi:hypothetical protein